MKIKSGILAFLLIFSYLFSINVSADETPNFLFEKSKTYQDNFSDINYADWYYDYVISAYEFGVMSGYEDGNFNPDGNITICESITVASRIRSQANKITIPTFEGEYWYTMYVKFAESMGIIPKDVFSSRYEDNITRAEYIYILYNSLTSEELTNENPYIFEIPDMNKSDKYYDVILKAMKSGIVTGKDSNGNYYPNDKITRAEASTILNRLIDRDKRISHIRKIKAEKELTQPYDKTEYFQDNKALLNYGYHNDISSIFYGYYTGTSTAVYCYLYKEKELNSYFEKLKSYGYKINTEFSSTYEKLYNISSTANNFSFKIYLFDYFDQLWVEFPWDNEYKELFKEMQKENTNSEEVSKKEKEKWEKSDTYLENPAIPNLGKLLNRECIRRELFTAGNGTKVRYVYKYFPNDFLIFYNKILNKGFEIETLLTDSNELFLDTTYKSRNTNIRIFLNFIDYTITLEFPKTMQSDL